MSINYAKVNEELVKIARGLGYTIKMYDEKGDGPIADPVNAKFIYLEPDGIMIAVPTGNTSEHDEIYIYVGKKKDMSKFLTLIQRVKVASHFNGLGMTIRNFENDSMSPKDFADDARIARDNLAAEE